MVNDRKIRGLTMGGINDNRTQVSRHLSKESTSGIYSSVADLQEFGQRVIQLYADAQVDQRLIAVGNDGEIAQYAVIADLNETVQSMAWPFSAYRKMIIDICLSGSSALPNPKKILMSLTGLLDYEIELLARNDCDVTVLNNLPLMYLEKLRLNQDILARFGELEYNNMSMSEMEAGVADGQYDLVLVHGHDAFRVNGRRITQMLDAVKPDGMFVLYDASSHQEMYLEPEGVGTTYYGDYGRLVRDRPDFICYHVPLGLSFIVAKRLP